MNQQHLDPIHPGEILLEEFLTPMGLAPGTLAQGINVSVVLIEEMIQGDRNISADIALRLSRFFGTTERFWMNLQTRYDLETERERLGDRLEQEVQVYRATG